MRELTLPALRSNLNVVQEFVETALEENNCPMETILQISICLEELYVNVASYAYGEQTGEATISYQISNNPRSITITIIDSGVEFNPLAKKDADITLSAQERSIGGLGIYMVKNMMDTVDYRYENSKNIMSITKLF